MISLINKYHSKQLAQGVEKATNCIIMPVLDFKNEIPIAGTRYVPKPDWQAHLKGDARVVSLRAGQCQVQLSIYPCEGQGRVWCATWETAGATG